MAMKSDLPGTVDESTNRPVKSSRLRELASGVIVLLVVVAVIVTVSRNREAFSTSLHEIGFGGMALSLVFGVAAVAGTYLQWRAVLIGLDVHFGLLEGAKVFFVSQLGKYVPGSVWPVVMQMDAGRRRGANKKTIIAANLITVVLSIVVGVTLAGALLPFAYPAALQRFWWALAALPLLAVLAHPKAIPFLLDRLLRVLHRAPLGVQMTNRATGQAMMWSIVTWVFFGLHLTVLAAAVGEPSAGLLALCIGGMGLAVSAGVLFLPSPAGAGMREVVLGYVLGAVLSTGQVLAVVVASRVLLILVDLLLAGAFAAIRRPAAARR
ncbi:lysylphosphatidylglycerol synthase domain-containing protein [Jatrophihabitans sp. DSM 45814]